MLYVLREKPDAVAALLTCFALHTCFYCTYFALLSFCGGAGAARRVLQLLLYLLAFTLLTCFYLIALLSFCGGAGAARRILGQKSDAVPRILQGAWLAGVLRLWTGVLRLSSGVLRLQSGVLRLEFSKEFGWHVC